MKGVAGKRTRGLCTGSRLKCVDNTGAKEVEVVMVPNYHGVHRRYPQAGVADVVHITVKKGTPQMRKQMFPAVIVQQRRPWRRPDGTIIQFESNAVVIITPEGELKGSEIKGAIAREAAERWARIAAKAGTII